MNKFRDAWNEETNTNRRLVIYDPGERLTDEQLERLDDLRAKGETPVLLPDNGRRRHPDDDE